MEISMAKFSRERRLFALAVAKKPSWLDPLPTSSSLGLKYRGRPWEGGSRLRLDSQLGPRFENHSPMMGRPSPMRMTRQNEWTASPTQENGVEHLCAQASGDGVAADPKPQKEGA
jgi:hypothetical protein